MSAEVPHSLGLSISHSLAAMETATLHQKSVSPDLNLCGITKLEDCLAPELLRQLGLSPQLTPVFIAEVQQLLKLFHEMSVDPRRLRHALRGRIGDGGFKRSESDHISRSEAVRAAFERASNIAAENSAPIIMVHHLLAALLEIPDTHTCDLLTEYGVDVDALCEKAARLPTPTIQHPRNGLIDQFGTDLTARAVAGNLPPVIGRRDEMMRVVKILGRDKKNCPVLVGAAGVGKPGIDQRFERCAGIIGIGITPQRGQCCPVERTIQRQHAQRPEAAAQIMVRKPVITEAHGQRHIVILVVVIEDQIAEGVNPGVVTFVQQRQHLCRRRAVALGDLAGGQRHRQCMAAEQLGDGAGIRRVRSAAGTRRDQRRAFGFTQRIQAHIRPLHTGRQRPAAGGHQQTAGGIMHREGADEPVIPHVIEDDERLPIGQQPTEAQCSVRFGIDGGIIPEVSADGGLQRRDARRLPDRQPQHTVAEVPPHLTVVSQRRRQRALAHPAHAVDRDGMFGNGGGFGRGADDGRPDRVGVQRLQSFVVSLFALDEVSRDGPHTDEIPQRDLIAQQVDKLIERGVFSAGRTAVHGIDLIESEFRRDRAVVPGDHQRRDRLAPAQGAQVFRPHPRGSRQCRAAHQHKPGAGRDGVRDLFAEGLTPAGQAHLVPPHLQPGSRERCEQAAHE